MKSSTIVSLPASSSTPSRLIAAGVRDANRAWRSGRDRYIENVLEIARHVYAVWQECERSKISFRSLFKEGVETAFEFDRSTASKFLAVARNPALADGSHGNHSIPSDLHTLAKLAQVPAPKLKRLIETETITPNMRRADVAALVNNASPVRQKPSVRQRAANDELEEAYEGLRQRLLKLPRDRMLEVLRSLANDCGASEILK